MEITGDNIICMLLVVCGTAVAIAAILKGYEF